MKRAAIIPVLILFLISTTGVTVNSFYCCGRLKSSSLFAGGYTNKERVTSGGYECCQVRQQIIRIEDEYSYSGSPAVPHPPLSVIISSFPSQILSWPLREVCSIPATGYRKCHFSGGAIYKVNCIYRI